MKRVIKTILGLGLFLTLLVCLGASACAESWSGNVTVDHDITINETLNITGDSVITINPGCTLTVNNPNSDEGLYGQQGGIYRSLTVQGGGTLKVTAGRNGFRAFQNLVFDGCTVEINAGSFGLNSCRYVTLKSGKITINLSGVYSSTYGFGSGYGTTISGGELVTNGANGAVFCSSGYVSITGGKVTANGPVSSRSYSNVTLSWTNSDDFITAAYFEAPYASVSIAEGKYFTDGTSLYDSSTPAATLTALRNVTLRPATPVTVSFSSGGGSGTMAPVQVAAGYAYKLPGCNFTPPDADHQFKAWSYNGQEYAAGTPFTINADTTFTAVWEDIPPTLYTVSFAPNGGGGTMAPVQVQAGGIYNLPECGFTPPAGQRFRSWMLGSTEFVPGDPVIVDCDATFVAVWDHAPGPGQDSPAPGFVWFGGNGGGWDAPQQRAYRLILAPTEHGSAILTVADGQTAGEMNVYPHTTVKVTAAPDPGYTLDKIIWSLIDGSASYDITQTGSFVMPGMDAVVHVTFKPLG